MGAISVSYEAPLTSVRGTVEARRLQDGQVELTIQESRLKRLGNGRWQTRMVNLLIPAADWTTATKLEVNMAEDPPSGVDLLGEAAELLGRLHQAGIGMERTGDDPDPLLDLAREADPLGDRIRAWLNGEPDPGPGVDFDLNGSGHVSHRLGQLVGELLQEGRGDDDLRILGTLMELAGVIVASRPTGERAGLLAAAGSHLRASLKPGGQP